MKIIGITGGFKTGKTTALNICKNLGAEVIDADKIAHKCLAYQEVIDEIKNHFRNAPEVVENNIVSRDKLAQIVFSNNDELQWLNNLIHPLVAIDIENLLKGIKKKNSEALVVIEIPLLYEADMAYLVDEVMVLSTKREIQIERALKDGFSRDDALKRIESQFDLLKKEECGDFVINNNSSIENTKKQIIDIFKRISEENNI